MNKKGTRYFPIWLFISFLFFPIALLAQDVPSLKEIKRSGRYYSGDADGYDTLKIKEAARTELMSVISKQLKDISSLNGKSEILVKYIQYLVKLLGDDGYTKVVAYVPIENVTQIIENKETLQVTEMKYTDAPLKFGSEERPDKPEDISDLKTKVPEKIAESEVSVTEIKKDPNPSAIGTLLERLVACSTIVELGTILESEKSNNKLIYSVSEAFRRINSSENFYIVLIDPVTKKIVSFFDKGSAERRDLKYGKMSMNIENDAKSLIQVWIQLF